MQEVDKLIKEHNWKDILNWGISLKDNERLSTIEYLNNLDIDKDLLGGRPNEYNKEYYSKRGKVDSAHKFARVVCTRSFEDVQKTVIATEWTKHSALYSYMFDPSLGYESLIQFYKIFPPNYLNSYLQTLSKERFFNANFKVLWKFYEQGWIPFDEEFLVRRLFTLYIFENNHYNDAQFLIDHPKLVEQVFLKFYKYQIPVLDLIKSESIDYSNGLSAKASVYWTEVFKILIEKNAITDRVVVKNLLESLLNNWKKPHLDWHIRLLELFQPTKDEYLKYQSILFSCLHTTNITIVNFAVKCIEQIYKEKEFLIDDFIQNASSVFMKEKCEKTILSILNMIDFLATHNTGIQSNLHNSIAIALLQKDAKVQLKTTELIIKFTDKGIIQDIVNPYIDNLKPAIKKTLNITETSSIEETSVITINDSYEALTIPSNWDDLLFHIGTCINSKSSTDIDLFIEGLNQLQDKIPADFEKQVKPFTKKLNAGRWEVYVMVYFEEFINNWTKGAGKYPEHKDSDSTIPFLHHKLKLLFNKLKKKSNLPFLSTPTHYPYYIDPEVLVDRLLQYESVKEEVDIEDLIIACNRIMMPLINDNVKSKAENLKGKYAEAIQYLVGVSSKIETGSGLLALLKKLSDTDELLPLWAQIARTKEPGKTYSEFQSTPAKEIPAVVAPFLPTFTVDSDGVWTRLSMEGNWNHRWSSAKPKKYPRLYYYAASVNLANRLDILYQISLVPNYVDALLCRYLPDTSSGNEVNELEQCFYPMNSLVEYKLKVHQGGWLYVAFCLLFEKKVSRDLAAEYITIAIQNKFTGIENLLHDISKLISLKFAPVNRLMEFIDRNGNSREVKEFQLLILESCILTIKQDDVPTNFKKIVAAFNDLTEELKIKVKSEVSCKIKEMKK